MVLCLSMVVRMIIMRVIEMTGGGIEVSLALCALSPRRYSCYIYLLSHGLCSKSGEARLESLYSSAYLTALSL